MIHKKSLAAKAYSILKAVFFIMLLLFFLPLIVLSFYNHASADDYICGINLHKFGLFSYQAFIYKNWGGRFVATFIGSLFANKDFLYEHYFLHTLLLLLLNFLSLYFLVFIFNKYVLQNAVLKKKIAFVCLMFMALAICCMPAAGDFLFWFSSAITYNLPLILIQIEIALFILLIHNQSAFTKMSCCVLLPLLVFIINGFNELFIVCQAFILFSLVFFNLIKSKFLQAALFAAFAVSAGIVLFAPGNKTRFDILVPKSLLASSSAFLYNVAAVLWNIFDIPLFWFVAVSMFLYGKMYKPKYEQIQLIKKFQNKVWLLPSAILFFLIAAVGLATIELKGGIVPSRYLNAVTYCMLALLLICFFVAGVTLNTELIQIGKKYRNFAVYSLLITGLLCNNYIPKACSSIISAPMYNSILTERENTLKNAAATHITAVVNDYNTALQQHLQTDYSNSTKTLSDIIQKKPELLFFQDDLASDYSINMLKEFYKLDSISIKTR